MDSAKYMVMVTVGRGSFPNQYEVFVFATDPDDAIENVKALITGTGGRLDNVTFEAEID